MPAGWRTCKQKTDSSHRTLCQPEHSGGWGTGDTETEVTKRLYDEHLELQVPFTDPVNPGDGISHPAAEEGGQFTPWKGRSQRLKNEHESQLMAGIRCCN